MVVRLFVPPGEGQHNLVPRRSDSIGANATTQYVLFGSTALAGAYTSFATRRVGGVGAGRTAVFIRASGRLGVWGAVVGAALNVYYYAGFANVVVGQSRGVPEVDRRKWKLFERTTRYTVEDGALAGASLGLLASASIFLRRASMIPVWTRCVGMMNIGACTGVLGTHAYLHYTGERQRAYRQLEQRLKRRSLEFWYIFWDKSLMARLDPLMQQYVRHNGVWYTQLLPAEEFDEQLEEEEEEEYRREMMMMGGERRPTDAEEAQHHQEEEEGEEEQPSYYIPPIDYADDLRKITVEATLATMLELEAERAALLQEAEYLLHVNAQQQYEYCHLDDDEGDATTMDKEDDDERQRRLQEIHLVEIAYHRLRSAADAIDIRLVHWRISLQHKALWESSEQDSVGVAAWLPKSSTLDYSTYTPSLSMHEMLKFQAQIADEVAHFDQLAADGRFAWERRERYRRDAEDGRVLLRAADHVVRRLERATRERESGPVGEGKGGDASGSVKAVGYPEEVEATTKIAGIKVETVPDDESAAQRQVEEDKVKKAPSRSLERERP
ncbi:hypothetical protein BDW02DRAFT_558875 [Decorospora gaudefroyi]|uniref:Uncharacterized protein n=1 Tax=Decorospora gaudefroyi TaxID=184978 RepID=A0A6A5K0P4_9PLEO|nr:hypothetical protein BDW02DRAFT_558875 [Decorospora gaudefroyi]